jgi:hypothetical protein
MTMLAFTCVAMKASDPPKRIGIIATCREGAIQTAQEIFPNHVLGIVSLEPEWTDDPA